MDIQRRMKLEEHKPNYYDNPLYGDESEEQRQLRKVSRRKEYIGMLTIWASR